MKPIRLTLCLSVIIRLVGPSVSDGARWHSSDGDGQKMVIKCSNLEKKKEKNKMVIKAKV